MADQRQGVPTALPLPLPQEQEALKAPQQMVHLNWSNFKPEFLRKPDKDTEAHLLYTNDWINAQLVEQQTFMQGVLGSIPTPNSTWPGLTQPSIPLWVGKMSTQHM